MFRMDRFYRKSSVLINIYIFLHCCHYHHYITKLDKFLDSARYVNCTFELRFEKDTYNNLIILISHGNYLLLDFLLGEPVNSYQRHDQHRLGITLYVVQKLYVETVLSKFHQNLGKN